MSEYILDIGECYDNRRMKLCLSYLHQLGLVQKNIFGKFGGQNVDLLNVSGKSLKTVSLLNLATVSLFLDYVGKLFDTPTYELMKNDDFSNLPFWQESLWVPLEFSPSKVFERDRDGPFFFGSAPRLLLTLNKVKKLSRIPLGKVPEGYEQMVQDYDLFIEKFDGFSDNSSCIQWVWKCLHYATEIAMQNSLPLLRFGL